MLPKSLLLTLSCSSKMKHGNLWSLGLHIRGCCPEVTSGSLCLCATHSWCSRGPTAHRARGEVIPRSLTFRLKPLSSHTNLVSFCHFVSCDTVLHADTLPLAPLPPPLCSTSYRKKNLATVNQCLLRRPWFQTHCVLGSHKAPPTHLLFSWLHANSSHEWV